jgi:hypothetical protein
MRAPIRYLRDNILGLVAAIGELKAEREGELQVHGSGTLVRWLLDNELVDEVRSGVSIQVYRPAGRPRYEAASA